MLLVTSGGAPSPEVALLKSTLRRQLRRRRSALTPEARRAHSDAAAQRLIECGQLEECRLLAAYAAVRSEADPSRVVRWHRQRGGQVAFPKVEGERLRWYLAEPEALRSTPPWSIPEPVADPDREVSVSQIEAFVVPGLGFTRDGHRIGYGRGFYDRTLAGSSAATIGFAYEIQLVDTLPAEPHDLQLSAVVTETMVHWGGLAAERRGPQ